MLVQYYYLMTAPNKTGSNWSDMHKNSCTKYIELQVHSVVGAWSLSICQRQAHLHRSPCYRLLSFIPLIHSSMRCGSTYKCKIKRLLDGRDYLQYVHPPNCMDTDRVKTFGLHVTVRSLELDLECGLSLISWILGVNVSQSMLICTRSMHFPNFAYSSAGFTDSKVWHTKRSACTSLFPPGVT